MSQLATPFLYRNLVLPYDEHDKDWEKLHVVASSRGILDGHVRAISIGDSDDYPEQRVCRSLHRLIESLPNDTLQSFWYSPLARPQHEDLKLLWKTQKTLTNLLFDFSLGPPTASDILGEGSLELRSLVSISQITIYFEAGLPDPSTLDFLKMMNDMFPNLQELMLHFMPRNPDLSLDDSPLAAPLLSRCLPRTLTHIGLYYVSIKYVGEVPLDDFTVLKHLELVECGTVGMLLDNYSRPALETFTYRHDCNVDTVASTAVLKFLQRFQHLKRLIIDCHECLTPFESTAASSIMSHAASLEYLLIDCKTAHVEEPYEGSFLEAASKCKRLEQLSISFRVLDCIELGAVSRKRGISYSSLIFH